MLDDTMRCSMSGIPIQDSRDGIWDDGEWISWSYINRQIAIQDGELEEDRYTLAPQPDDPELQWLITEAIHEDDTGDGPSRQWGPIGELYMQKYFRVALCRKRNAQGHDGRLGNDVVEIKTMTPAKNRPVIRVKRKANFSLLAVVRVSPKHEFDALVVRRERLPMSGEGDWLYIHWKELCELAEPLDSFLRNDGPVGEE